MPGPAPTATSPSWWKRWRSHRVEVHDDSMRPTLLPGDRLLVDPRAYRAARPGVGDLVVVQDPHAPERWLVKRVAAVGPGRWWPTDAGLVSNEVPPPGSGVPIDLDEGAIWVVGDAPETSRDSRRFGPIGPESVVGRAFYCYAPIPRRRSLEPPR